jgi:peptidoglycan/LPS O-acetylase OafA/YrhL
VPDEPESTIPVGIRSSTRFLAELESLRGVAIALVFAFHADAFLCFRLHGPNSPWPWIPQAFVWSGHTGVTLFFVLSSFLLSLPFFAEAYGERRVLRREFYARRALRILPLFYAMVLVAVVATAHRPSDLSRAVPYLTFLFWKPGLADPLPPFNGVWWSLATEVQFYVLLPIVALAFGRSRWVTLPLLGAFAILWTAVAVGWVLPTMHPWVRSLTVVGRGPLFLSGILAAWLYHRHGTTLRERLAASPWFRNGGGDMLLLLVLFLLGCHLRWKLLQPPAGIGSGRELLGLVPDGVLWAMVVLIVILCPLRAKVLCSNRFLAWLGVLSYSVYLLHWPLLRATLEVLHRLAPQAGGWTLVTTVWFVLSTALCLGIAMLTYRYIERPFLIRKARLDAAARLSPARPA